jgi:CheY-like chemotaxis protein
MENRSKKYKKVLLIDDDQIINHINKRLMEIHNIAEEIYDFRSCSEALAYLNNQSDFPEIIILDIQMPTMDGFEFLENYKNLPALKTANCRLIILSSTDNEEELKKIRDNKYVYDFFSKPLCLEQLQSL